MESLVEIQQTELLPHLLNRLVLDDKIKVVVLLRDMKERHGLTVELLQIILFDFLFIVLESQLIELLLHLNTVRTAFLLEKNDLAVPIFDAFVQRIDGIRHKKRNEKELFKVWGRQVETIVCRFLRLVTKPVPLDAE